MDKSNIDKDINLDALKNPFKEKDLEWRPQSFYQSDRGNKALVLCYVTARAVMNRLDECVGAANWKDEYVHLPNGVMCGLSISAVDGEWVTKWDGAEETNIESFKGGISSALKRAAVKWGIGRYLYNLTDTWVDVVPERPVVRDAWRINRVYDKKTGIKGYFLAPELPANLK